MTTAFRQFSLKVVQEQNKNNKDDIEAKNMWPQVNREIRTFYYEDMQVYIL